MSLLQPGSDAGLVHGVLSSRCEWSAGVYTLTVVFILVPILTLPPQFTAGEPMYGRKKAGWNNFRSGSIFTAKIDKRSLYGHIRRFIRVRCPVTGAYLLG